MALPVPTKAFLQASPDTAMLLICTFLVHLPTSPCPILSAHAEPKSQGHCRIVEVTIKLKVSRHMKSLGRKGLTWYRVNVDLSMQSYYVAAVYVKLIRERGSVLYLGIAKEISNLPIVMYQHGIVTNPKPRLLREL